jgi:intein-encoded DNA endonuclease-like protein
MTDMNITEALELRKQGASIAEIAGHLAECKIMVSKDTVQRFLRAAKHPRLKKSKPVTAT